MIKKLLIGALCAVAMTGAAQAAVVNIDSTSATGTTLNLSAGTYSFGAVGTAAGGAYNAYSYQASGFNPIVPAVSGCSATGTNCASGFRSNFTITVGGVTTHYNLSGSGSSTANNFQTATQALAAFQAGPVYQTLGNVSTISPLTFTLASNAAVTFAVDDDLLFDNTGGVSLNVAAVPEPASWAMMIVGVGLVGGALRRREGKAKLAVA